MERSINISFFYVRTDTCSTCNQVMSKKTAHFVEKFKIESKIEMIELETEKYSSTELQATTVNLCLQHAHLGQNVFYLYPELVARKGIAYP